MTPAFWFNGTAILLAGLFNLLGAWRKLDQEINFHPFIRPWQNFWIWLWIMAQMFFAGVVCWFLLDLAHQPIPQTFNQVFTPETFNTIFPTLPKAALVGIGFNAVLNADEATDFLGLNLGSIYKGLIAPITSQIHTTQTQTDRFWTGVYQHLSELSTSQMNKGLLLLREKIENNQELTQERRQSLLTTVKQIQALEIPRQERPGEIVKILKESVRRQSLPELLKALGCQDSFFRGYVPKRSQNRFLSNQ
jgi:hypothetical protein